MASASSVEELNREKRHCGNFVLETLQIKTFQLTPRATDLIRKFPSDSGKRYYYVKGIVLYLAVKSRRRK